LPERLARDTSPGSAPLNPLKRNQEQWRISKQRHVYQFLIGVWPYIIVKRLAVGTALAYFTNRYGWEA